MNNLEFVNIIEFESLSDLLHTLNKVNYTTNHSSFTFDKFLRLFMLLHNLFFMKIDYLLSISNSVNIQVIF